jgi:hypothetical protein
MTESKKLKFSYPFGIGAFLMSGCFQFTGMSDQDSSKNNPSNEEKRRKRHKKRQDLNENPNSSDYAKFCSKYAKLEKNIECSV